MLNGQSGKYKPMDRTKRRVLWLALGLPLSLLLLTAFLFWRITVRGFLFQSVVFAPLGTVTRIEVRQRDKMLATITDPAQIGAIVRLVDEHRSGWGTPLFGVPVPQVTADFYAASEFKGHFGVGSGFFESQREGDFVSMPITARQQRRFLRVVGVTGDILSSP